MYYQTLPAEHIDLALDAESDRMHGALFDPEETESERTVITSERRDNENRPMFWLTEELRAAAFRVHGYHHTIIGDMVDLHRMTRDELYSYYRQHYTPANAVIVAVGAFNTADMIRDIERYYGSLSTDTAPELFTRPEPPQSGERRITVERPGKTAFVTIGHRVPSALHDDWFKLEIMDSILTGAGGGIDQKTSRLYRSLVKTGIAASVSGGLSETVDPYLYNISATVNDGRTLAETESAILEQIERIQQDGITDAELQRAHKQARAAFAYATESITNQAYWLAQSAMLGDLYWFETFLDRLATVTRDDVRDVARRYLTPQGRVIGWLVPTEEDQAVTA